MKTFHNQTFDSFDDRDSAATFHDMVFTKCHFESCELSITRTPTLRSTLHNMKLLNCSQRDCAISAAVIEDVVVDGLNTNGQLFQTWGAVFNRTVLQGKIDRLMISSAVLPGVINHEEQRAFDDANNDYYDHVEWALDISKGEFKEICIRGLPGCLIRRDPETQILVTRERALLGDWKNLNFKEHLLPISLEIFLQRADSSIVLVAPKRHSRFKRYLDDINLLRLAGVAEPD
jgi:hypothetical protein